MKKWISAGAAGLVGAALAAFAAYGVISTNTAAPANNPVNSGKVIPYGDR